MLTFSSGVYKSSKKSSIMHGRNENGNLGDPHLKSKTSEAARECRIEREKRGIN
jgi:hypothetical protein